jgi:hypothetical protein
LEVLLSYATHGVRFSDADEGTRSWLRCGRLPGRSAGKRRGEALRVGGQGVFDLFPGRHAAVAAAAAAAAAGSSDGLGAAMREYFACAIVHR